ncbi:Hypothetical protein D9617_26g079190 [Elsinoe fawcettii]|nr:Hypothetical protein D9617_26g079190 [Elsinoe fawcettii]
MVAVTQLHRLVVESTAERIADGLDVPIGEEVSLQQTDSRLGHFDTLVGDIEDLKAIIVSARSDTI